MKANELFPGALARVNRDGLCIKKDTIVEVRAVDADDKLIEKGLVGSAHCHPLYDNQFDGGIWCEYLDPIPLTPEILEENGFIRRGENQWYINNKARLDLGILSFGIDDGCGVGFCLMPNADCTFFAKYVHELQYALWLCGIKHDIKL